MLKPFIALVTLALPLPLWADLAKGLDAAAASKWQDAYKEFKQPAERGNSSAQVNLGNLYMKGLGVEQSYPEALKWYEKAALQGNPVAQAKMGILYFYGLGVPENRAKAIEWFIRAGDQGDAEAAMVLAQLYMGGDGTPKNAKEAYLWSSIASELGKVEAASIRAELAQELAPRDIEDTLTRLSIWLEQHSQRMENAARLTPKNTKKASAAAEPIPLIPEAAKNEKKKGTEDETGALPKPTTPAQGDNAPGPLPLSEKRAQPPK